MGFLSGIGGVVNDVLGGSASAKQAQKYNKRLMAMENAYNEKFAKNAHQWEVEDLKSAGLNPALSTGGSSAGSIASQDVSGGSAMGSTNGNIGDIMGMVSSLASAKANNATAGKQAAETAQIVEGLPFISKEKQAQINNITADTVLKGAQKSNAMADTKLKKSKKETEDVTELAKKIGKKALSQTRESYNKKHSAKKVNKNEGYYAGYEYMY